MRINRFLAQATGISRREADKAVLAGRVLLNDQQARHGQEVTDADTVYLDGKPVILAGTTTTIMLNKPQGYVCSRSGQGSKTVYDLLPDKLHELKSVGRLDKESSGLLLLTNDGQLANQLTHPKYEKTKVYKIALNKPLNTAHLQTITGAGIMLEDGLSRLHMDRLNNTDNSNWKVTMHEGRNRQIRRTFESLGYTVVKLHRTKFGQYALKGLAVGDYILVPHG